MLFYTKGMFAKYILSFILKMHIQTYGLIYVFKHIWEYFHEFLEVLEQF